MSENLVYIGKIIEFTPIHGADFIHCATVVCGTGGKWRGIVRKDEFSLHDLCVVFLPDCQLNESDHAFMPFMKDSGWRVKMRKFKGAPSEVVIISIKTAGSYNESLDLVTSKEIGSDVTLLMGATKYNKPVPSHLQGQQKGDFPSFIPKTDELNYQRYGDLVDKLVGKPYYITEKCDGSSTTAYRKDGELHVCSRNLELTRDDNNGYWKVALKYKLDEKLPENIALQWETCGPGVQSNPMGMSELDGYAFSAYDFSKNEYLPMTELFDLCDKIGFPRAKLDEFGESFSKDGLETLGEGKYASGKHREGVVVRSQDNVVSHPISFKVINLDYKEA